MPAGEQHELSDPPNDAISSLQYYPGPSLRLLVSSWDKHVYLYDTTQVGETNGKLINKYEHRGPVLDACFGANENEAFSAGLDCQVKRIDLETLEQSVLSVHNAAVNCLVYDKSHSLLISSSWDCTLHIHFMALPSNSPITISLPAKPHALTLSQTKLVVAMTSRLLHIYELSSIVALSQHPSDTTSTLKPWQERESSLKFMTRAVASMPDDAGYASSSIEGRVTVEWFDPSNDSQMRKFAFKCHRHVDNTGVGTDTVYPVNALAFHPVVHTTFASGGGDNYVLLWDVIGRRRIRQYQEYPASVAALAFSSDGRYLAVGVCPALENGQEDYCGEGLTRVFIRELGENEAKGRTKH